MSVQFSYLPSGDAWRVPLVMAEYSPQQRPAAALDRTLLIGARRSSAGTATSGTLVPVTSAADAAAKWGKGSQIAHMAEAYFRNDPTGTVWTVGLVDPSGAAGSGSIAVAGPATANGTLHLYIGGRYVPVSVLSGDSANTIAAAINTALAAAVDLPVSATVSTNTVTITSRHVAAIGNEIDLRANWRGEEGGETTPSGVTLTITQLSSGSGVSDLTTAITAIEAETFRWIVLGFNLDTELDEMGTEMGSVSGRWSYLRAQYGHVVTAYNDTQANLTTHGNGRNDPHVTMFGLDNSPTPWWEIAAAAAGQIAAKLRAAGPGAPCTGLKLEGVLAPARGDRFTITERNTLLFDGVATLYIDATGAVRIDREITTYQINAASQPDASQLDLQVPAISQYIAADLQGEFSGYQDYKLADDGTVFGAGQRVMTPAIARGICLARFAEYERDGLVEDRATFEEDLLVERNGADANRLDVVFPPDMINQLRTVAISVRPRV